VQVKSGSNLVGVRPIGLAIDPTVIDLILTKVRTGIETLEDRSEAPPDFPIRAIRHLRDLGKIEGEGDGEDTKIKVWVKRQPIAVTYHTVANAIDLLKEAFADYGSVEGRLQVASERGSLHVIVYEPVWDKPIRCNLPEEKLQECLGLFGQRVEIFGLVHYRHDGAPISVDVEDVLPFPRAEDLPTPNDVRGILRDYA
jgi:hypothetical protein